MKLTDLASKGMFDTKGKMTQYYYNKFVKPVLAPTSTNTASQNSNKAVKANKPTTTRRVGRFVIEEEKDGGGMDEMVEYKGGSYKVYVGPRGGRYLRVRGSKVYLSK